MTDRYTALVVVLDKPLRSDDAESLIEAIGHLRGVGTVKPITAEPVAEGIAISRRDRQWRETLFALAHSGPGESGTEGSPQ